jgi:hypothetical protein
MTPKELKTIWILRWVSLYFHVTIKNSKILFKSESIHDDPHHQRYQIMQQLAKSMK